MNSYFPFTNYDFYAYLTSGAVTLALFDYLYFNSEYLYFQNWRFVQIAFVVLVAYVVGHIVAMLAQLVIESFLASVVINKPAALQLGYASPSRVEKVLGLMAGRYYGPLSPISQSLILTALRTEADASERMDLETALFLAHRRALESESVGRRLEDFRNQYGFCRNIAFVALVAAILSVVKIWEGRDIHGFAIIMFLGFLLMFVRFLKFLSSFHAELFRAVK